MNNSGSPLQTPTLAMEFPSRPDPISSPRLLVLVPTDADYSAATRRLWELANASKAHIQLLGLYKDAAQEPALRRDLVTMASLLRGSRVSVDFKIERGTNWVEAVKRNMQACDLIVCFAEQRAGLLNRPLSQILQSNLNATVYILSGLSSQTRSTPGWPFPVLTWVGSIAIIISFGILQTNIIRVSVDWLQNVLLILATLAEFWLLRVWNSRCG